MNLEELKTKSLLAADAAIKQVSKKIKDNPIDQWYDFKYWERTWMHTFRIMTSSSEASSQANFKYQWPAESLKAANLAKRFRQGRGGQALKMTGEFFESTYLGAGYMNDNLFSDPEHTVLYNDMVPNQLLVAMHLKTFMLENAINTLVEYDQNAVHKYFDHIYSMGLPQTTCTYSSQGPAVIFSDEQPGEKCPCMIVNNRACEATMTSWAAVQEKFNNIPTYRLDVPEKWNQDPEVIDDFVEDLKGMIAFVSEHTGAKMDWDLLRHICENMNEIARIETELYEYNRGPNPPLCNELCWYPNMAWCYLGPSADLGVMYYRKQLELARIAHEKGECSVKNMKWRSILWDPPAFVYATFWTWLEQCWGIGCVMDLETYREQVFIDTRTPESMLRGLAETYCDAPMARHNRGPASNYLGDLEEARRLYRPDFILVTNHMSCRGAVAMTGAVKEWSQEKNCPACYIDYDMYDNRIVSRQQIRDQVNRFMFDVMHAEPLDPSLLEFDDSQDW